TTHPPASPPPPPTPSVGGGGGGGAPPPRNLFGKKIYPPKAISDHNYDVVIIATLTGIESVPQQLIDLGVDRYKINVEYVTVPVRARIVFLEKLGEMLKERKSEGSVAEGGVFQGDFAREINRVFPDKTLYLFDTFAGFDKKDAAKDVINGFSEFADKISYFEMTSEDIVKAKLPYPNKAIIKKGFFPQTAQGIDDRFCFVNLDFDLYDPILAGLRFFHPKLVEGGAILIHDYFNPEYGGVKSAIADFGKEYKINPTPIGDGFSVAIYR
ncbi:MAG: TylF/MycF family methyltransferase, partial [Helicobacteraceae bacterium]|nr:TylF/MycF family methyltransferase [Helicobacteraceae bacterium]